MTYDLKGKKVLVTGASVGIGAALAKGFAERGAVVGICARREDKLAGVLAELQKHSPESRSWAIDLADLDGLAPFAAKVVDELGGVDVLVNNAGIPKRRVVTDLTPDVVESVMAINYFSPIRLTLALLPQLIERKGRIVNISSVAARFGPPSEAAYSASKAALTAWSESMQVDLGLHDTGVLVHVVNPGVIDTDLFHLPDNEESMADIEALPVEAMVQPVVDQLDSGLFELYVPEYMGEVAKGKAADTGAFLQNSINWARDKVTS